MSDTVYGKTASRRDRRWYALVVLCVAQLMVFLDATVVNVALPTIQQHLHFSQTSLSWVVNAYLLTFGGCLLLAGRAGDLFGRRRLFTAGLILFTAASLDCALAGSQATLIAGRAVQGLGAAVVSAVGLSMIVTLFAEPADRARAMGIFSFVASGGGTLGVIFGGVLIQALGWRSIFVINLPIGVAILALVPRLVERDAEASAGRRLDVLGAVTVTGSVMLALLGCVRAGTDGWGSPTTLGLLGGAAATMVLFVVVEARAAAPLMPLRLFRSRELSAANGLAALLRAAMFSWFFFSALYMQRVLGFSALETGLGYLPAMLVIGVFSYKLTAVIVGKVGARGPFVAGSALMGLGLGSFALAPVGGSYAAHVLPGMLLIGVGGGMLFMPLILTATASVGREDAGIASGLVTTSQQLGGALGLAVLVALAAARAHHLGATRSALNAPDGGFHAAFLVGAALALVAAAIGWALLADRPASPVPAPSAASSSVESDGADGTAANAGTA